MKPTEDEIHRWMETLSNWGRWGEDDQLGTLNFITPEKRRSAAARAVEGTSVSCAWNIEFPAVQPVDLATRVSQRVMLREGGQSLDGPRAGGAVEHIGMVFHGHSITHIDSLSHAFWDGKLYNGRSAPDEVTASGGARRYAVTNLPNGIVTRGVLLDIPAVRGVDWLEAGEGVHPEDLLAAEERQGVVVERGDAVLLRTGYGRRKALHGPSTLADGYPGWHASCLPWLHEREVAVIATDTATDVIPSGYSEPDFPVHIVGIVAMGLWLIDNCDFESLVEAAMTFGRYEFLFVVAPLRLSGASGSPINPLALF